MTFKRKEKQKRKIERRTEKKAKKKEKRTENREQRTENKSNKVNGSKANDIYNFTLVSDSPVILDLCILPASLV